MKKYFISSLENTYGSDSLKEEVRSMVKSDSEIIYNPSYTDYGGSFMDKVLIAWAKKYHPNDIVSENTSWNGENAFIFGETAKNLPNDFYNYGEVEISEVYADLENEMIEEALEDIFSDYDFSDYENANYVRSAVCMALNEYGSPQPNMYDYYTPEVIEVAQNILKEEDGIELNFADYEK